MEALKQRQKKEDVYLVPKSYERFLSGIKSPTSVPTYRSALRAFCKFIDTDTDTLVSMAVREISGKVEDFLTGQKKRVEDGEIMPSVVKVRFAAIKLFFEMNDIILNWKKLSKILPAMRTLEDRAYKKDEIVKMLDHADVREKVILLLMASSGMRIGAIADLKIKHVEPIMIDNNLLAARVRVYSGEGEKYYTFMTPECYRAIQEYIAFRKRNHELVTEDSPLIRDTMMTERVPKDIQTVKNGEHLAPASLETVMHRLIYRAGIRVKEDRRRYDVKLSNGFRKFFNTTCRKNKVDLLHKEMLMGHSTKFLPLLNLEDSYYRPVDDPLLTEYFKVVNDLTFNDAEVLREELKNLRQESKKELDLRKQVDELHEQLRSAKDEIKVEFDRAVKNAIKATLRAKGAAGSVSVKNDGSWSISLSDNDTTRIVERIAAVNRELEQLEEED